MLRRRPRDIVEGADSKDAELSAGAPQFSSIDSNGSSSSSKDTSTTTGFETETPKSSLGPGSTNL